jgi:DNA-binding XRE family transcriptional regulator
MVQGRWTPTNGPTSRPWFCQEGLSVDQAQELVPNVVMPRHQSAHVPPALGPALKAARVHAGKTVSQAAEAVNVDPSTLDNWESGRTEPRCSQVLRLALFLEARPLDLFRTLVA